MRFPDQLELYRFNYGDVYLHDKKVLCIRYNHLEEGTFHPSEEVIRIWFDSESHIDSLNPAYPSDAEYEYVLTRYPEALL